MTTTNTGAAPITKRNIDTSEGGRAYVAEFFAKRLRRHDFGSYITQRLAADFACALAAYLSDHEAVLAAATTPQTDGATVAPDECGQDVYKHGQSIGLFDIPKDTANAICAGITAVTGARVDWHYIAGRVHMKALAATHAPAMAETQTDAARDVLAERARQIAVEGWTPEHDDRYRYGEMGSAAGCYAMHTLAYPAGDPPPKWPWIQAWWKPTTERQNRVKAAALLLAEIERIDRAAASGGEQGS